MIPLSTLQDASSKAAKGINCMLVVYAIHEAVNNATLPAGAHIIYNPWQYALCAAGAFAALCACAISVGSKSKATGAADAAGAAFQATDGSDGPWQPASQFKEEAWMDDATPSAWGAPHAADTEDSWMPGPEMRGGAEDTAMAGSLGVLSAAGVPTAVALGQTRSRQCLHKLVGFLTQTLTITMLK